MGICLSDMHEIQVQKIIKRLCLTQPANERKPCLEGLRVNLWLGKELRAQAWLFRWTQRLCWDLRNLKTCICLEI